LIFRFIIQSRKTPLPLGGGYKVQRLSEDVLFLCVFVLFLWKNVIY
jgi:hypothetical protein